MPFFGFGQRAAEAGAHHRRQPSLSLSSSKDARIAAVRAETVAMANSGELTFSRSKGSSGHNKSTPGHMRSSSGHMRPTSYSPQHVVAIEADEDSSKHTKRIDQGILDASREMLDDIRKKQHQQQTQQQQQTAHVSWWSSFSYGSGTTIGKRIVSPAVDVNSNMQQLQQLQETEDTGTLQRKTTVSKTFRVP